MEQGLTAEQARKLVKPEQNVTAQANWKLEQMFKEFSLTHPDRVQKAASVYDKALSGKPLYPKGEKPSNSQVLQVAKEILDRQYPKVSVSQNLNINSNLAPIDLEKYRR